MNGYGMLNEAARLIGLDTADQKLKILGLTLLNTALADLGFKSVPTLSLRLPDMGVKGAEAVKFCLAALMANAIGDSEMAENMSAIYRGKKAKIQFAVEKVKDTLPRGEW